MAIAWCVESIGAQRHAFPRIAGNVLLSELRALSLLVVSSIYVFHLQAISLFFSSSPGSSASRLVIRRLHHSTVSERTLVHLESSSIQLGEYRLALHRTLGLRLRPVRAFQRRLSHPGSRSILRADLPFRALSPVARTKQKANYKEIRTRFRRSMHIYAYFAASASNRLHVGRGAGAGWLRAWIHCASLQVHRRDRG